MISRLEKPWHAVPGNHETTWSESACTTFARIFGHDGQYATDYAPIRIRAAIIPATRIGSNLSWPLLIAGLIFNWSVLVWAGILLFGLVTVFQLATLPVEFNASRRALAAIESRNLLTDDELRGARSVLRAAAMTYVAALLVSFAQLLRLIILYGNRRRD